MWVDVPGVWIQWGVLACNLTTRGSYTKSPFSPEGLRDVSGRCPCGRKSQLTEKLPRPSSISPKELFGRCWPNQGPLPRLAIVFLSLLFPSRRFPPIPFSFTIMVIRQQKGEKLITTSQPQTRSFLIRYRLTIHLAIRGRFQWAFEASQQALALLRRSH